jgi:hypothetical protein
MTLNEKQKEQLTNAILEKKKEMVRREFFHFLVKLCIASSMMFCAVAVLQWDMQWFRAGAFFLITAVAASVLSS